MFAPREKRWKLFGISVMLNSGAPEAPAVEPQQPAEVSTDIPGPPTPTVNPKRAAGAEGR